MNSSKSKFSYPPPKRYIMTVTELNGEFECIEDVITADGKAIRRSYSGKYDGNDYPIEGDPDMDSISCSPVKDNKSTYVIKKDGKVVIQGESIISDDGKTWIDKGSGNYADGNAFSFIIYMEKQ